MAGDRASNQARATCRGVAPVAGGDLVHDRDVVESLDRRPREEGDLLLFAQVDDRLRATIGEVVAVLDRHDRRELLGTAELLLRDVGQPDVADLALILQLDEGADGIFEWHRRVGAMKLVERDLFQLQPPQAAFAGADEVLGPAVLRPLPGAWSLEPALGRDDHVVRIRATTPHR